MTASNYQTIYDASQQQFPWLVTAVPLAMALGGIIIFMQRKWIPSGYRLGITIGGMALASFGFCFALFIFASTLSSYQTATSLLATNKAAIVEGLVQNLTSEAGGKAESFTVQGIKFSYSEYSESIGFHHVSSAGRPIKDGLQVKIWCADIEGDPSVPVILKLEISP